MFMIVITIMVILGCVRLSSWVFLWDGSTHSWIIIAIIHYMIFTIKYSSLPCHREAPVLLFHHQVPLDPENEAYWYCYFIFLATAFGFFSQTA